MTEALVDWTAVFVANAIFQVPVVAAGAYVVVRLMGRPHPQVEHLVWAGASTASVLLPFWTAARAYSKTPTQVSLEAP